jgi:hypothetical protein
VIIHGPVYVDAKVTDKGDGTYVVNYICTSKGLYDVYVGLNGFQISGSPFKVLISPAEISPELCVATGSLKTTAGIAGIFYIQGKDMFDNNRTKGGGDVRLRYLYFL